MIGNGNCYKFGSQMLVANNFGPDALLLIIKRTEIGNGPWGEGVGVPQVIMRRCFTKDNKVTLSYIFLLLK